MKQPKVKTWRYYLKWVLWILVVQLILVNISASIYAHKFTHFYDGPPPQHTSQNVFGKTWKLFVGPKFYKNTQQTFPQFPCDSFRLQLANGLSIDGWYGQSDSSKTCVIFLHGLSMNKSSLLREASKFKQWGYSVLLIDFRAHGNSDGNNSSLGMRETEEAQKAFEWAKQKGNDRIIFYGVSLGAVVSLKATAEKKVQPYAIIADAPFRDLRSHLRARSRSLGFPSEPFGTLVTMWIGIEQGYNGFDHDVNKYARDIHCPVLLQCGEKDRYVSMDDMKEVQKNLASPTKLLIFYPNADHESYLRIEPLGWETTVKGFLDSLPR